MNIIVDNLATNYQLTGKGKLVVILHGWGDSLRSFSALQKELSGTYSVLAIDLPGFGGTQAPQDIWGLDEYANFVENTVNKLELQPIYAIIGHSNGGAIAIRAIARGKLQPAKLILLAAAGIRSGKSLKLLALKILTKTGNLATIWMPEVQRQRLRASLYGAAGSDMLVVPELEETFKKVVSQDVRDDAAQLSVPTLLIYADHDLAVPIKHGIAYKKLIQNSQLEIIHQASHFVHHDQPAKVTKLIMDFLK